MSPPHPEALWLSISSSSFSSVPKKAGQRTLSPPPLSPRIQKGTEAPDGLVLAEGFREAATPQRPLLGLRASPSCCQAQPPSWQRSRAQGQPPQHEASSPCQLPLPSLPPASLGREARSPAEKQSIASCLSLKHQGLGPKRPVGTLGFPRREEK